MKLSLPNINMNELYNNIIDRHKSLNIEIFYSDIDGVILSTFENNKIYEQYNMNEKDFAIDSIYVARVDKIVENLGYAFVDIGYKKSAFLPLVEKLSFMFNNSNKLKQGDKILVQIKKEAYDDKAPMLTRDIKIPGAFLMYMPFNTHITVSSRISDIKLKQRLINIGKSFSKNEYGIVFRKNAEKAQLKKLKKELDYQIKLFDSMNRRYMNVNAPYCIYKPPNDIGITLSEFCKTKQSIIIKTNNEYILDQILNNSFIKAHACLDKNLKVSPRKKQDKKIILDDGSNIIIDYCTALTVFDINSNDISDDTKKTFLDINILSLEEIARQIRYNNISGIILIDFINMNSTENKIIFKLANELFSYDTVQTNVHGFTTTGLMEITRRRMKSIQYEYKK